jgi:hypothetical protein
VLVGLGYAATAAYSEIKKIFRNKKFYRNKKLFNFRTVVSAE